MIYSSLDKIFRLLLPIEEGGEHDYWRREGRTFVYARVEYVTESVYNHTWII